MNNVRFFLLRIDCLSKNLTITFKYRNRMSIFFLGRVSIVYGLIIYAKKTINKKVIFRGTGYKIVHHKAHDLKGYLLSDKLC
jgi:hypothetical protein